MKKICSTAQKKKLCTLNGVAVIFTHPVSLEGLAQVTLCSFFSVNDCRKFDMTSGSTRLHCYSRTNMGVISGWCLQQITDPTVGLLYSRLCSIRYQ